LRFVKSQLGFLLFGVIIWLPIAVAVLVFSFAFNILERVGKDFLGFFAPTKSLHAGFGTLAGIVLLYLSGVLFQKTKAGNLFSKMPLIGAFFSKGGGKTITVDRLMRLQPCLFLYSPSCLSYGWILSEEKVKLGRREAPFTVVNVYHPSVPTIVVGQVFPVRKEAVVRLGNSSREVIDLLLYGMRSPAFLQYLPWDDEDEDEFCERAQACGLSLLTSRGARASAS
jgi:uncharacterized membrane protein